ncbi:MAG TPA: methionyl-tRNA formyltransferase [Candidatus Acidoferrales bacterium]|nr:methionyl-tRNA formyltransferase [Candidatus Acidoferrales bacterium]
MALRIVFCGTPAFAVPALDHLIAQPDIRVEGVVTQPDRPRGRGNEISVSPVKAAALAAGIDVFQPEKVRAPESVAYFERVAPDCVVIIAYGQIIPAKLIAIPRLGWINVHASLLPKYRGAAPINWAIINGETVTGLTTMQIDPGLDTGPMLLKTELSIGPDETAPELSVRLAQAGAPLIVETLRLVEAGEITPEPQDNSQATLAPPLEKSDGAIDWQLSAQFIYNRIRGLQPWPGAFTGFRGKICQIWGRLRTLEQILAANPGASVTYASIKSPLPSAPPGSIHAGKLGVSVMCGEGALWLDFVQLEGRKRVTAAEFANGARLAPGERFG